MMNLELSLRVIDVICEIMQAKAELKSDDDMYDIIEIIFTSIIAAYRKNDQFALEKLLSNAETIIETM